MKLINAAKEIIQDWQDLGKIEANTIEELRKAMIKAEKDEKAMLKALRQVRRMIQDSKRGLSRPVTDADEFVTKALKQYRQK